MNNWNDVRNFLENDTPLSRVPDGMELIPVVGVSFIPGYPNNLLELQKRHLNRSEDILVTLKRNPDNPYDSNACEVHVGEEMLGHIPKDIAARLSPTMDSGVVYKALVFQVRVSPENPNNPGVDIIVGELHDPTN